MKVKIGFLTVAISSLLLSNSIFAAVTRSLTKGCSGSSNCQITNDNSSSYTVTFG